MGPPSILVKETEPEVCTWPKKTDTGCGYWANIGYCAQRMARLWLIQWGKEMAFTKGEILHRVGIHAAGVRSATPVCTRELHICNSSEKCVCYNHDNEGHISTRRWGQAGQGRFICKAQPTHGGSQRSSQRHWNAQKYWHIIKSFVSDVTDKVWRNLQLLLESVIHGHAPKWEITLLDLQQPVRHLLGHICGWYGRTAQQPSKQRTNHVSLICGIVPIYPLHSTVSLYYYSITIKVKYLCYKYDNGLFTVASRKRFSANEWHLSLYWGWSQVIWCFLRTYGVVSHRGLMGLESVCSSVIL